MTPGNRPTPFSCALAALTAAVLVLAVSCGGASHHAPRPPQASQLVGQALGGRAAVRSGLVDLSLALLAPSVRESFTLHSATRFRLAAAGAVPNLLLTLATLSRSGSTPPRGLKVALASGPRGVSLSIQGRAVHAGSEAQRALQAGYGQLAGSPAGGPGAPLAPLGLEAAGWLVDPHYVGRGPEPSAQTAHVRAGLAVAPFLTDIGHLAVVSEGLSLASGRTDSSSLALALVKAAQGESGTGTVDLYADPRNGLPRSMSVSASLHPVGPGAPGHAHPPVVVSLRMSFTALGEPGGAGAS
jgi:hypothetical protein